MARFLRTVLHQDVALAPGAAPLEKDLGVNPISFLTMTLRLLNNGANAVPSLANILAVLSNVEVLFKGTTIVGGRLDDLAEIVARMWGYFPIVAHRSKVDNDILNITCWVPFTRKPFDMKECFPATRKGDLTLKLTPAAAFTGIDTLTMQVEQTELLDAVPERFPKITTKTKTPAATGLEDLDLPLGNPILGVLLFGTTVPDGASQVSSIETVKVLVDNVETDYSLTNWESLYGDGGLKVMPWRDLYEHLHIENIAAAYTQFADTGGAQLIGAADHRYAYLDFDPLGDGVYALDTAGRGRVNLQINHGVVDAVRALPIELIVLPGAAQATAA